jgi:serine phosphatase RsbU (regulator of sigma subunit)
VSHARPGRRLLLVAAVIALALAGAGAALAWQGYRDARAAELEEVADAALASAADIDQYLAGRVQLLQALATTEGILSGDPATIERRLDALDLEELGFTAGIAWFDPSNLVRASTGPLVAAPVRERVLRGALIRARSSDEPFISGAAPASIVFPAPAIMMAVPTRGADGRINGALAAGLGLEHLNDMEASPSPVRGGRVAIVDRTGRLIVAPGFVNASRVGDDPLVRRAQAQAGDPGMVRGGAVAGARGLDGRSDQLIGYAYEPTRSGWTVLVGRDAADALGDARRTLWLQLGGLALLAAVGIGGAALVGRRLDRLAGERDELLAATRRAEERSAFLARAAAALDEEPRLAGRLQRLADLCVPALGDRCVVELTAQEGEPALTAAAPPGAAEAGGPGEHSLATPLLVGGRPIGSLAVARRQDGSPYEDEDAELAQRLAELAALQLESARMYEREHEIAGVLQRSLLPDELPPVPGVALAARYLAAGAAVEAGGDWYEAVPLGDGRVALAVGDVVGKGSRAAAAMGRLRSALQAFAMQGLGPAELLARLSRFAEAVPEANCATVALAVVGADGEVVYACAGHPYPLLLSADGGSQLLRDGRGGPLAAWESVRFGEGRVRLGPGDAVALYTDGLVERRGEGLDAGLTRLEEAARPLSGRRAEDICDGLLAALGGDSASDDVALLVARLGADEEPAPRRADPEAVPARHG